MSEQQPILFSPPMPVDLFLQKHWQKSPLHMQGAMNRVPDFIDANEMAALAMEDEVESRLIVQNEIKDGGTDWQLQHGPFDEEDFSHIPESNWTLLIQTLEYWHPPVRTLRQCFDFIPDWRLDDIMLSFATDGGGVGPHTDKYDVFLVQGEGERRWRVGTANQKVKHFTTDCGIRQVESFSPQIDVVTRPGDVLYIPPNTPHWGESVGDSYCYSIGFRAPSKSQVLANIAQYLENSEHHHSTKVSPTNDLFNDAYRDQARRDNKLEEELFNWVSHFLHEIADDRDLLNQVLGESLSQSKLDPFAAPEMDGQVLSPHSPSIQKRHSHSSANLIGYAIPLEFCLNWNQVGEKIQLWIEGEAFEFEASAAPMIEQIARHQPISEENWLFFEHSLAIIETLTRIENKGYLFRPVD